MQSPKVTTCNFDKSLIIILYIERRIFALSSALLSSCNLYFMIQWDNSVNYVSKFKCFIQCRKSYWDINPCKKFFPTAKFKINLGALTLLLKMTTNKSDSFLPTPYASTLWQEKSHIQRSIVSKSFERSIRTAAE